MDTPETFSLQHSPIPGVLVLKLSFLTITCYFLAEQQSFSTVDSSRQVTWCNARIFHYHLQFNTLSSIVERLKLMKKGEQIYEHMAVMYCKYRCRKRPIPGTGFAKTIFTAAECMQR